MAKEWVLNSAMNRYQLNFTRNVGKVSEEIRRCSPSTKEQWEEYYYTKVRNREHIDELGKRLYTKITEVLQSEIRDISVDDCIHYMHEIVIDKTFQGYQTEINTVYGILEKELQCQISPAPDDWDRNYSVDFYIQVHNAYIGLQIKPISSNIQIPVIYDQHNQQIKAHKKFTKKYQGEVFYIFSTKVGSKKEIVNSDVIDQIRNEIARLT